MTSTDQDLRTLPEDNLPGESLDERLLYEATRIVMELLREEPRWLKGYGLAQLPGRWTQFCRYMKDLEERARQEFDACVMYDLGMPEPLPTNMRAAILLAVNHIVGNLPLTRPVVALQADTLLAISDYMGAATAADFSSRGPRTFEEFCESRRPPRLH
jgi:hypothetical protein